MSAVVLGLLVWLAWPMPPRERVYQGKTLAELAEEFETNRTGGHQSQFEKAVEAAGTNAIPTLLRFVRAHDSAFKTQLLDIARRQNLFRVRHASDSTLNYAGSLGFFQLKTRGASAVPDLVRIYEQNISTSSKFSAVESLSFIGPDARQAIPALLRDTGNTDYNIRLNAFAALSFIHDNPEVLVPLFTRGLGDTAGWIQYYSAIGLGYFGPTAKAAVPALTDYLNKGAPAGSTIPDVRAMVLVALKRIDPAAAEKLNTE